MVIVGSDYTDVASPAELSVNARIAVNLGAPVVLAVRAKDRSVEQVVHAVEVCLAELSAQRAHTAAVVANRCEPTQLTAITEALRPLAPKTYAVPDEPLLVAPTVADLQAAVNGTLVSGDTELMSREVMGVVVAGMTADHVLERLREATAVVTPGDRSDVVLAVASAHAAEGFPSLSCIILNGGFELHRSTGALVAGLRLRLPIIATTLGTFETASAVGSARGRVTTTSQRKVDTALQLIESHVDLSDLLAQLAIPIPKVTTPQMFTYQLRERARSDRKRIVLPEGDDDRILKSAGRVLQRGIADLTILGDESQIRARAAELGVNLDDVAVFDPRTSDLCDQFAEQYAQLRAKKGVTVEQAREIIHDVSYFGTMLVYNGMVDGMVSGAAHTTAHTVRPGFRDHRHRAGHLNGVQRLLDVPAGSGSGVRRLRDRPRPDRRGACRHRDQRRADRRAVRHRATSGHAVVFHRRVRLGSRRRQGQGGNRIGPQPGTAGAGRGADPIRRRGRAVRCCHKDARLAGRRQGHRADISGPERRQQRLQGGAT